MKRVLVFACVLCAAGLALAEDPVAAEKAAGTNAEYHLAGPRSFTYNGVLDSSDPIWDRIYGCNVDPACAASCFDSGVNGQYYEAIPIGVTAAENLECEVVSFPSDSTITLYCDPFNPATPLTNVVAYDDDDGVGTLSAFTAADGILLQPGNTYWLIMSTFSSAVTGAFQIDCTSATVYVIPVELQSFTIE